MDNERIWGILFEAIEQNRVVPIIGDEFFYAEVGAELVNYKKHILNELISKFNPPKDIIPDFNMISGLIEAQNVLLRATGNFSNATSIYYEIGDIVRNTPIVCDQCLTDFIQSFKFPLILSTSYLPGIEQLLANQGFEVKAYDKSPRIDIPHADMVTSPTLYYLFGKCGKANKTYMATEDDLLEYIHYWHNIETRPMRLSEYLSDKFLLMLGCDYPNWLFRFFWHSVKNFNLLSGSSEVKGVVAGSILNTDNELSRFLARIQTHTYANGRDFMKELREKKETVTNFTSPKIPEINRNDDRPCDIFISYSHKDDKAAEAISAIIEAQGASVWFDSSNLIGSDHYDDIIRNKITECQRFVPILSTATETEKRGYFRKEWSLAVEESKFRLGSPYIAPIAINEIDYNSKLIPKEFKDSHILSYNSQDFENEIKRLIRSFRQ